MMYVVGGLALRLISISSREVLRSDEIEEDIWFVDKCKQTTTIPYRTTTVTAAVN
jgi:hypothetical protein